MTSCKSNNIRVLIFTPHAAAGGGVVNFIHVLTRYLDPRFNAEQFVIGQRPGFIGKALRSLVPLFDSLRLVLLLFARRHDVYHINPSLGLRAVIRDGVFLLVMRIFRCRNILVFIHGWDEEFYCQIAASPTLRFLFRLAYSHAARVLVLASSFARKLELLGLSPERIRVVTTMFDGAPIQQLSKSRKNRSIQIIFLARFVAEKGIYELLTAFKNISEDDLDIELVMAGAGPEYQRARDWCTTHNLTQRVRFPGYVEGVEKAQLLLDSDIFVLPSSHGEGCPIALLEAMGAGLPVIVTPIGGIPDIVQDGINGIVLKTADSNAVTEALLRLLSDADMRAKMGAQNREKAWRYYEAQSVTRSIEMDYQNIANAREHQTSM